MLTIVIPTHNRPAMLLEAVASVKAQTATCEIVVVDSGKEPAGEPRGCRYLHLPEPPSGVSVLSWLVGASMVQTEFMSFLYDDDLLEPTFAESMMSLIEYYDADVGVCNATIFGPGGERPNIQIDADRGPVYRDTMIDAVCKMPMTITPACCVLRTRAVLDHLHPGHIGLMQRGLVGPDKLMLLGAMHDARTVVWDSAQLVRLREWDGSTTTAGMATPQFAAKYRAAVDAFRLLARGQR
jgi:hypothetical protein